MLIPVLYAGLNAGDELLEHSYLVSQGRRTSGNRIISKEPLVDGILHLGASEMLRLRIVQDLLQLEILVAEAIDLFLR